jgi:hypothetical protein
MKDTNWSQLKVYPTITTNTNSETVANLLFILAVVEILTVVLFFYLYWLNKRGILRLRNNYSATLTEKYQLDENIRAIYIMTPMVLTHFCCFIPQLILLPIYIIVNPNFSPIDYVVFRETYSFILFYCVALPFVLFWRHKTLRQNLRAAIGMQIIVSPEEQGADGRTREQLRHFELLKEMWNASEINRRSQN